MTEETTYKTSALGFALVLIGAAAMVIGVFLPRAETSQFSLGGIEQNTLIQNGDGWVFIIFGLATAGAAYRAWSAGKRTWMPLVFGILAAGGAYGESQADSMTLYHLNIDGSVNYDLGSITANPGIGIWAVGLGGLLSLVGGYIMRRDAVETPPTPALAAVAPTAVPPPPGAPVIAAGWHADPHGRHDHRYHDGARWTEHVATAGQQAVDPPVTA